jgi:hypothetical protein
MGGQAPVAQRRQQVAPLLLAGDDRDDRDPIDQGGYEAGQDVWVVREQLVDANQNGGLPLKVGGHARNGAEQRNLLQLLEFACLYTERAFMPGSIRVKNAAARRFFPSLSFWGKPTGAAGYTI